MLHDNMYLDINGVGHIFLINRLNNKLYFFYKVDDVYRVAVFKFDPDFVLDCVDSSRKYLIVKSSKDQVHKYKVFNI